MNVTTIMSELTQAQQMGVQLSSPTTWANRADAAAFITGLFTLLITLINQVWGYSFTIDPTTLQAICTSLAAFVVWAVNYVHTAANSNASLPKVTFTTPNIFTLFSELGDATALGNSLSNGAAWANQAAFTGSLVAIGTFGITLVNSFTNLNLSVDSGTLQTWCTGIAVAALFITNHIHMAANVDAGKVKK